MKQFWHYFLLTSKQTITTGLDDVKWRGGGGVFTVNGINSLGPMHNPVVFNCRTYETPYELRNSPFIIIIASWEFPLMSNAPILNVFHILQLWASHGFFIVVSHSRRSCAFLANVLTSSPPQSEMSSNHVPDGLPRTFVPSIKPWTTTFSFFELSILWIWPNSLNFRYAIVCIVFSLIRSFLLIFSFRAFAVQLIRNLRL